VKETAVRYTIVGQWRGAEAVVNWESGSFDGTPGAVDAIRAQVAPGDDVARLTTALSLIGRTLDRVDQLRVDDGEHPWDFDAKPVRPLSAWRRRQMLRSGEPSPPQIA
jgi:hypothetical protein